ncbi:MAG: alanine--tRNA ligase [Clostridiales bacterium]|jgi:alanyl-tRNA synthetase|nr:alanine--tRNA ligase [Clostridiales bacterium]
MKNLNKTIIVYVSLTVFAFVLNWAYSLFSHGVSSYAMEYMYLWLFGCGVVVFTLIRLFFKNITGHKRYRLFYNLYNSGVAVLLTGMLLRGILEIAGGSSPYIKFYYWVAYAFLAAGVTVFVIIIVKRRSFKMNAQEMRDTFFNFFISKGHKRVMSASILPENDPSVLFTTAGMHPLVPYLLGERHPLGKRLVGVQKCLRTDDIDEVGDNFHHTYFEMLGNWSLGDYFKSEAIKMSFEFLTSVLRIPSDKLVVTVFGGYEDIPRDFEAYECWKAAGLNDNQIFFGGMKENWWGPVGNTGPCGPDTEIFYDTETDSCGENCGPFCDCGRFVEIWNNVFMQYNKDSDGHFDVLSQKNVDTGMGLERILTVFNHLPSDYETDIFKPIIEKLEDLTGMTYDGDSKKSFRIIVDHMRAVTFVIGDQKKIVPSNTEQGYIVRRLIRRCIRHIKKLGVETNILPEIVQTVITVNAPVYPELLENRDFILEQIDKEYSLFISTLDKGVKKAEKFFKDIPAGGCLSSELAFKLYDTYGFPIEFTQELADEKGISVDIDGFKKKYLQHQEESRSSSEGTFKGGLADNSEQTTRLHTATHLLNAALRQVLGDDVYQRGSNITPERLRFDFSFDRKLTDNELAKVSQIVNEAI